MEFSEKDFGRFIQAMDYAAQQHRLQKRKGISEASYIIHPMRVTRHLYDTGGIRDIEVLIAGLLHDTIEDTGADRDDLVEMFGERVAAMVCELTDNKCLPKEERKRLQIVNAPHKSTPARAIKLADKIYNLNDLATDPPANWDLNRKLDYCLWAEKVVSGMRESNEHGEPNVGLLKLFDETLAQTRRVLDKANRGYEDMGQNECQV